MGLRQGWMEKRQFERIDATVKVTYTVVPKGELVRVMSEPAYRESSMDHLPELSKKSATVHAVALRTILIVSILLPEGWAASLGAISRADVVMAAPE